MTGRCRAKAGSWAICIAACAGTLFPLAPIQARPGAQPAVSAAAITGRDFAGLRFPLAPTRGAIGFSAARVSTWTESGTANPGPEAGPLQRLFLSGDVRVRLGLYEFEAANAVVWLQKVQNSLTPGSPGVYQVFVYFDRLGNPTADAQNFAGVSVSADRLPVRGVIEAESAIGLTADLLNRGRPGEALIAEAEASLAKTLRAVAGIAEPAPPPSEELPIAARGVRAPIPIAPPEQPEQQIARAEPGAKPEAPIDRRADAGGARREPITPPSRPPQRPGPAQPEAQKPIADRRATPAPVQPVAPPPEQPGVQPGEPVSPTEIARTPTERAPLPAAQRPFRPSSELSPAAEVQELVKGLPPAEASRPIFVKEGLVSLDASSFDFVSAPEENALIAKDGVAVQYTDGRTLDTLQITAQRAVIFLSPGPLQQYTRFAPEQIRGIYLEGDVVASSSKGDDVRKQYTMRGPQMYYDLQRNKAIVLDAVFWTYDASRRLPLYVRATTIKQEAANQFTATTARLANTAFFDPELAIGASSLTISRREAVPDADGAAPTGRADAFGRLGGIGEPAPGPPGGAAQKSGVYVDARDITLRTSELPFFYFPRYTGDPTTIPLKDIRIENSSSSGTALKTTWNSLNLLGFQKAGTFDSDLLLDYYFYRGAAIGTAMEWGDPGGRGPYKGGLFGYLIINDEGTDVLTSGQKVDRDGGARGLVLGENRWKLDDRWTIFAEGAYIGDENFIDAFFEPLGQTRREFTNRALARRLEGNTALTLEAKAEFNDFIANEYLLQTPGYQTDKLPEAAYFRQSDDLLGGVAPGLLSWFSEYRLGRLSLNFDKPTASQHGFTTNALAQRALGIDRNESVADRLRAQGYEEEGIFRADTRQEISSQLAAGPLNITPFVIGRVTAWDSDFQSFSPEEDDNARLWGGAGVRVATTLQRVDDTVDSRILDLHRTRHIIEPGLTIMQSGTNVDSVNLPIYDEYVEGINEGGQVRLGVNQTWQTKRGGPGRWHDVDAFKLNTEVVFASDDMDRQTPIGRFYDFRPEYSVPGNYLNVEGLWQVTSVAAISGSNIYDFELDQQSRSNIGILFEHSPAFRSYFDVRYINSQDATFLLMGTAYEFEKYAVSLFADYNTTEGGFQNVSAEVRRRSAAVMIGANVSYNDITGETSFGFLLQPLGVRGGGARLRGLGGSGSASRSTDFGG
ncbi:MAG: hypothetical protein IT436_04435 [Phycisphaerales bacterium]|nr:hypothetical protein [Phycisphaerales bacterium]